MASRLQLTFAIKFPENLLNALCYKTDVEPIPRGIELRKMPPPYYMNNPNWKKIIVGCYWCGSKKVEIQGICCSMKCLFIFHEWCIEVAQKFAKQRFCRLPGCDTPPKGSCICCCEVHMEKYNSLQRYGMSKKDLDSQLKIGPKWYDSEMKTSSPANRNQNTSSKTSPKKPFSRKETPKMDIALELRTRLIFDTDVGPVPRSFKKEEHLSSPHSSSPNWNVDITGCHMCGKKVSDTAEYLCSKMCYSAFNEWCRHMLLNSSKFCKLPGCGLLANPGAVFCSKEHEKQFSENIKLNTSLVDKGPIWYQCNSADKIPNSSFPTAKKKYFSQNIPPQFHYSGPHFLFSQQLTEFLYYNTDVGPIPREIQTFMPPAPLNLANQQNWLTVITQCYWCCASRPTFQGITCSDKCFFLLNEWLHNKFTNFSNIRLCRVLGCSYFASQGFQCCNREHSVKFESSFKKYFSLLKETEFNLGPAWYNDYSRILINFYHRKDPFYEFSNFYPCTNLYMSNINWKTSEHYFQASKFTGTPYFGYVSTCPAPRDVFKFARERAVQSWIRPDWHNVKLNVMYSVLVHKFQQDRGLLNILLRTGNAKIVDHTKNDKFWGDGGDGSGDNMLGTLLMRARDHLREMHPNMAPKPNQRNIPIPNPIPCNRQNQSVNPNNFSPSNTSPTHNTVRPQKLQMHSRDYHPPNSENTKRSVTNKSNKTTDPSTPIVETPNIQQPDSSTEQQQSGYTSDYYRIQSPGPKILIFTPGEAKKEPVDYKCPFNIPSSPFNDTEQITYNDSETSSSQDLGSSSNFLFNLAQVTAEVQEQSVDSSSEHFSLSNPFHPSFENIPVDPRECRASENTEEIVEPHNTNPFYPPTSGSCFSDQPMTSECVNKLDTQREDLPMEEDPFSDSRRIPFS